MEKGRGVYQRVEDIFAHAAALQQSGRLKNTIFCIKNRVYILNQDHTVLLKFMLHSKALNFEQPVSFEANDYDSPVFEVKDDKVCFIKKRDGYKCVKSCRTPQHTPIKMVKLFKSFSNKRIEKNRVSINSSFLSNLDTSLSHVEFKGDRKGLLVIQRNIYSGMIITIREDEDRKGLLQPDRSLMFEAVGLRTNDFVALFSFSNNVDFYFANEGFVWLRSRDPRMLFTGVISQCIYDEIGKV